MSKKEEFDLTKAAEKARSDLLRATEEVRRTLNTIRPEEPLLRKVRKRTMLKPLRRRVQKRIDDLLGVG